MSPTSLLTSHSYLKAVRQLAAARALLISLVVALWALALTGQTSGFIVARPYCVPATGTGHDTVNYIQGFDPILLSPGGDVAILVNAGQCCDGNWEALFSLMYPRNPSSSPQFYPIWGTSNWGNEPARNEHEAGFPSGIFANGSWHVAYTATFWQPPQCPDPNDPLCTSKDYDRVGRVDIGSLTTQATTDEVDNMWILPVDPACQPLGSCPGVGSGLLGTYVHHPNGQLFVYHSDGNAGCPSGWIRHHIGEDMSVFNPPGDGCLTFAGTVVPPTIWDMGGGNDGALYMLTSRPSNITNIDEWVSTGPADSIGLFWQLTGRTWVAPPGPVPGFPGEVYSVWDGSYMKDPSRQIVEPRVVVGQVSHGSTFDQIVDASRGYWYAYYWADAGADLPVTFGSSNLIAPPPSSFPSDFVWVEDQLPTGAHTDPDHDFLWDASQVASGSYSHTDRGAPAGIHQHYFYEASQPLGVGVSDTLVAYVLLDPCYPPQEVMLQWNDGEGWEHRAYWGNNQIPWGVDGTVSRWNMGPLPAIGQWVRLEVPAVLVGLVGVAANGMAFTLYDGQAWFDRAGKHDSTPTPTPTNTITPTGTPTPTRTPTPTLTPTPANTSTNTRTNTPTPTGPTPTPGSTFTLFGALTPQQELQVGSKEVGELFKTTQAGAVVGLRFWRSPSETGPHAVTLWDTAGNILARVSFAAGGGSGWQEQLLSQPVFISANQYCWVSYTVNSWTGATPDALYGGCNFGIPIVNGPLRTYCAGTNAAGQFPGAIGNDTTNYFADIRFQSGLVPTSTPTSVPTNTPTPTRTSTPTSTPTVTPSVTPSNTRTNTPTSTPSVTPSFLPTLTPTVTPSGTPSNTRTNTPTSTPTVTPSVTPSNTPSNTPKNTPTVTPSATPSNTRTNTPTNTATVTPTVTPSATPTAGVPQTTVATIDTTTVASATQIETQRAVWRNPRGMQYFYSILQRGTSGGLALYKSADGVTWSFVSQLNAGTTLSASASPYDDGANAQLVVYVAYGQSQTTFQNGAISYRRLVIPDGVSTPAIGAEQAVTGKTGDHVSIARDRNGFVHISRWQAGGCADHGRGISLFGSTTANPLDAPAWSASQDVIFDCSVSSWGDGTSEVAVFGGSSGNILGVVASRKMASDTQLWGINVAGFTPGAGTPYALGTAAAVEGGNTASNVYRPFNIVVDGANVAHVLYDLERNTSCSAPSICHALEYRKAAAAQTVQSWGSAVVLDSVTPTTLALSIDKSVSPNKLYAFWHDGTDTFVRRSTSPVDVATWNVVNTFGDGGTVSISRMQASRELVACRIPLLYTRQTGSPLLVRFANFAACP
jgi:hypothetical protein